MKKVYEGAHFTLVLNITKEELIHRNFRRALPAYLWYNFFFFLTTDTLKTDGTEESLHSTDESEEEENDTFISNM